MRNSTTSRHLLIPILAVVLSLTVAPVPAGRGNLGEPRTLTGSQVQVIIGSRTFTHTIVSGQTNTIVRNSLRDLINDPNSPFMATDSVDPFDPNAVVFEVLTRAGEEVHDLQMCETSTSLTDLGVQIPMGKAAVLIDLPTAVNANGTYRLTLRRWDGGPFDMTYNTANPPNNTPSGLIATLKADLTAAGFTVLQGGTFLSISRTNDMMTYVKIVATDTGIVNTCTRLLPSSGGVPTLSQYGFFALVALMTGAALLMLRRKSSERGAATRS